MTTVKLVPAAHQLPAPVQRAVAVNDGKQILIAGGLDANGTSTNGVFAYSPQTGHIAQVGTVPQAFHDAAGAMIGKDLFVFGGGSTESSNAVQSFDPSTGKGTVRGHLPMALSDLTGATIGHTVYLVGGWNGTSPQPTVWSTTDGSHFTKVATLPAGVRYPAVAAVGSNLVVAGGELASGSESTRVSLVDITSGHVQALAQLPEPTGHAMAFASGGIVYVAGGRDDVGTALDTVIAIDPSSGKLTAAPKMPMALSDSAVATTADGPTVFIGGAGLAATRTVLQTRTISTSSIAAPSAETLKDPPISTPFVQHLSPAAAQRPFAGKLLIADRGNNRLLVLNPSGNVTWTYPSPKLPAPPVPLLLPRRRVLGARRPRDPRERGGERRPGRDRLPEREDAVDVRPPAGRRLGARLHAPARRPLPLPRRRLGGRGREELPGAVLRSGGPPERTGRPDRELHPGLPKTRRIPERRDPDAERRSPRLGDQRSARQSPAQRNKKVDLDDDACPVSTRRRIRSR